MIGSIDRLHVRAVAGRRAGALPLDRHGRPVRPDRRAVRSRRSGWSSRVVPEPPPQPQAGAAAARAAPRSSVPSCCASTPASSCCTSCSTAMFVVVPPLHGARPAWRLPDHWKLYLPVVLVSFVADGAADPVRRPAQPAQTGAGRRASPCSCAVVLRWRWSTAPRAAPGRPAARFLRRFQRAGSDAAVAGVAHRPGAGAAAWRSGVYNTAQTLGLFFGGLLRGLGRDSTTGATAVFGVCAALVAASGLRLAVGMRARARRWSTRSAR